MPGGGSIADIYFAFRGDGARLKADAKKEGEAAGDVAGKGFKAKMQNAFKGGGLKQGLLGGLGLGAGLGGVSALTAATGALTDAVFSSIDAASDQREAMSLGTQVFEDQTGKIEAWAETAADAFGQSKTEALNFASNFGNAFKNVGYALDETADKSMEMTRLAADLGSAFNASSEEAATALRSGLLGESEPLRRFGVFLDEAAVNARAAAMGMKPLNGALTTGQKVAARYALIMEQTADSQGMFGRDTESLADAQKSLNAEMANVSAELGEALLPVIVEFTSFVKKTFIPALKDLSEQMDGSAESARSNENPLGNLLNLLDDLSKRGNESKTAIGFLDEELSNFLDDAIDTMTFWDTWTKATDDQAAAAAVSAEATRVSARNIVGLGRAADRAADPVEELGETGKKTGEKLVTAAVTAAESFKDFRDRVLGYARDVVERAYQIIEDKAELTAAAIESAELRKVIATGHATREQKARYLELGETQALLVLSLADNGVLAGKAVDAAMNDIRTRLETATGQERKALLATLTVLEQLRIKAAETAAAIGRIPRIVNPSTRYGPVPLAHGGPALAGRPYIVGERRPELFVPDVSGHVYPTVQAGLASLGGATTNITNVKVDGLMRARDPFELDWQLRRLQDRRRLTSEAEVA